MRQSFLRSVMRSWAANSSINSCSYIQVHPRVQKKGLNKLILLLREITWRVMHKTSLSVLLMDWKSKSLYNGVLVCQSISLRQAHCMASSQDQKSLTLRVQRSIWSQQAWDQSLANLKKLNLFRRKSKVSMTWLQMYYQYTSLQMVLRLNSMVKRAKELKT